SLAREVQPYSSIYGLPLAGWDPAKREVWLKGLSSVTWISRVSSPGAKPATSLIYIQSSGIYDIYLQPQGKYLAYTKDANGNETFQLYLYEIGASKTTLLSDGTTRSTEPVWSNTGDKLVYSSSPSGTQGVNLRLVNPSDPKTDHLFVSSPGGYFKAYDWSPDDKQVVYCDFPSNVANTLWLVDVASGNKTLLSPKSDQLELYDNPQFSKDGKGIYVVTDHDSDFRRLAYIDFASGKISYIPSPSRWDVDEFQLGPDGKLLAFVTNEDGISRLHLFDVIAGKERPAPQLPAGIISDLKWRRDSADLAFNFKSSRNPNDVYSVNTNTGKIEIWAKSDTNGFDTEKLSQPELIHWTAFDKRAVSGFLYRPPSKFKGKRPVIIDIHGGPEEQYRPGFLYENNYFLNELGVARIYPNVRGSLGYGKAFSHLDDGIKREGAVKDIGALLDWIKRQPDLDVDRVMVQGGSYGGYLALSAAYTYPTRIKAVASDSGITDLVSCAEHTEDWRRGLQRTEFGDEHDPNIRKFMERTAPLKNADKIKSALLISHGQNDPRVPVAEAASLVAATKNRVPVWYVMAKDEGHGFTQRSNRDYRLYASILFVKEFLLK
ncbi:MAG TPA: alpha/beta fold hydrolase, partial [Pyrinomonadaceae bacterium]|nr:alpha/beta fold hydrolase [Pyrinomonadaceae bacterium]